MLYFVNTILCCFVLSSPECFAKEKVPDKIGEWTKEKKVLEFVPDNLFDYINGDADRYLPYNFQKLTVLFYQDNTNADNTVEVQIYQMATHLDAFGIYSVHRDRNKDIFPYGKDGFIGENQAMFYQAQYFVKLMTRQSQNAKANLELFGKTISKLLPKLEDTIPELTCLDQPNKISRSECYLAKDVLAQSFLPRGTTVLYKIDNNTATGFIVMFRNNTETEKGWVKYKEYLEEVSAEFQIQGENTLIITSPSSETAILSLVKNRLVGVWFPGGDISQIQKLQEDIKSCLSQKIIQPDSDKVGK